MGELNERSAKQVILIYPSSGGYPPENSDFPTFVKGKSSTQKCFGEGYVIVLQDFVSGLDVDLQ